MAQKIYLKEACVLAGVSRRTLYRDMDAGNVSYHVDQRNRRYFDIAELCRVYGELNLPDGHPAAVAEPDAPAAVPALPGADLEKMVEMAVNRAIEPLLNELRELRAYQAEHLGIIEHQVKRLPAPVHEHSARARGERIAEQGALDDPYGLHDLVRSMREKDEAEQSGGVH